MLLRHLTPTSNEGLDSVPEPAPPLFADAWAQASNVPGWLTEAQARMLWDSASDLPSGGLMVEIGSHQGRSTIVLGTQARALGGRVIAIDPFVDGRLFGGAETRTLFEQNIERAGLLDVVDLRAEYSTKARPEWRQPIDYLYIDGKHDYWTLSDDLRWGLHLSEGAPVLIHDCYSSIGVTLGILVHVLFSSSLTYERREGSLALFSVKRPRLTDRMRILAEMPWWIRNVVIKILLRLRLRPVASLVFRHDSPYDPY